VNDEGIRLVPVYGQRYWIVPVAPDGDVVVEVCWAEVEAGGLERLVLTQMAY